MAPLTFFLAASTLALGVLMPTGNGPMNEPERLEGDATAPASSAWDYVTAADLFVPVDGVMVRVRQEGPKDAPVLLLIHGFTHSLEVWDDWADALSADYRVVRYDLKGHGLTGADPAKEYSPASRAAFVGAVMDALEIEKAVIAGNSLGGLAAWRFAADAPERVGGLVLVSPGGYPLNGVGDAPVAVPPAVRAYLTEPQDAVVRFAAMRTYGDPSRLSDDDLHRQALLMRHDNNGAAMVQSLEQFVLPDPDPVLSSLTVPTLILWGRRDGVVPVAQGERMAAVMPSAELIIYEDLGHVAQEEDPERTLADLRAFLKGL